MVAGGQESDRGFGQWLILLGVPASKARVTPILSVIYFIIKENEYAIQR
jgi:hypothetical protein